MTYTWKMLLRTIYNTRTLRIGRAKLVVRDHFRGRFAVFRCEEAWAFWVLARIDETSFLPRFLRGLQPSVFRSYPSFYCLIPLCCLNNFGLSDRHFLNADLQMHLSQVRCWHSYTSKIDPPWRYNRRPHASCSSKNQGLLTVQEFRSRIRNSPPPLL